VGGAVVFRAGQFRDGYGKTVRSGRYLRSGQQPANSRGAVTVGG
jgi:N-acyl-D-aspartate/D-glutamate deacylase